MAPKELSPRRAAALHAENEQLRARLADAEDMLRAIRSGEVDALLISTQGSEQVFTLKGAEHPYRVLVESMNEGAANLSPDGLVFYGNNKLASMLGLPLEHIIGSAFRGFVVQEDLQTFDAMIQKGLQGSATAELRLKAGMQNLPVYCSCRPLQHDQSVAVSVIITDISERKQAEAALRKAYDEMGRQVEERTEELSKANQTLLGEIVERKRMEDEIRHMAQHDSLTGLPNRRLFLDILQVELAQARRHMTKLAILFLDLDHFKDINDTLGHQAGDRLLKEVADRFRGTIREADTAARIGGDEFNILLAEITRSEDVSDIVKKIVDSLRKPVILDGNALHITTSIGISMYPDDGADVDKLLRYADIAMYHAKENGRNTFRYYNPSINTSSLERMKLESWLRHTIKRGELSVLYQPQIDIQSTKIRYAEALVRWNHPDRGFLEPKEFIPLAEETGFITSIDAWVLRTACAQSMAWRRSGLDSFCITVNLSARQFQSPDLVGLISSVLQDSEMPPTCLDLEVTESTAMSDVERSASRLRELRDMGVHISIDDFGTGYSSLNYLKKLPIERLKIDRSFIRDIATDSDDRAIIKAVTSMAHKMGIKTVAEGVETEEQLVFVRDAECDEAQGFLFSRPVPAEQFRALVQAGY